eukprot:11168889-Lingulodinium_polyedra.AAC.1
MFRTRARPEPGRATRARNASSSDRSPQECGSLQVVGRDVTLRAKALQEHVASGGAPQGPARRQWRWRRAPRGPFAGKT